MGFGAVIIEGFLKPGVLKGLLGGDALLRIVYEDAF
jgi:hypothetical protein